MRSSTFDLSMDVDEPSAPRSKVHHVEGNPTTEALQEIIEMLASDISAEISDESNKTSSGKAKSGLKRSTGSFVNLNQDGSNDQAAAPQQDEDRTLPLVLKSLHSTELSPPLRKVIAKLLPFLTYGQVSQSRELASYFSRYVSMDRLGALEGTSTAAADEENEDQQEGGINSGEILMNTFVETAINLPPVSVCENLRAELISNGFVDKVRSFLLKDAPAQPPSWSPALYSKSCKKLSESESSKLKEEWRNYFDRPGLSQAFKILTGLCSRHSPTQLLLSDIATIPLGAIGEDSMDVEDGSGQQDLNLLTLCHWMESTSDNTASNIKNDNGILAETLLDALKEDNETTSEKIGAIRKMTRDRKRELAEERRNKALVGMSAFGTLAGAAVSESRASVAASAPGSSSAQANASDGAEESAESRSMFASMFSSLLAAPASSQARTTRASSAAATANQVQQPKAQPSWMAEMEAMDDEAGATCAVCQEGRTLQPSELLGLYAYIKKVTITSSQGGGKGDIDGTVLLLSLPSTFPRSSFIGNRTEMEAFFNKARSASNALEGSTHALSAMASSSTSSSSSVRTNYYITTVSAGNAIHCTCHKKARTADRNHPKAPKSKRLLTLRCFFSLLIIVQTNTQLLLHYSTSCNIRRMGGCQSEELTSYM